MTPAAARGYAQLVRRAAPDFVEAKGVTPVPQWSKMGLTFDEMIPTHSEVRAFTELLRDELADLDGGYGLACEHRHSCAALLARKRDWCPDGVQWRTWIDFEAFHDLAGPGSEEEGAELVWSAPTPEWALWDSREAGFDPEDAPKQRARPRPDDYVDMAVRPGPRPADMQS